MRGHFEKGAWVEEAPSKSMKQLIAEEVAERMNDAYLELNDSLQLRAETELNKKIDKAIKRVDWNHASDIPVPTRTYLGFIREEWLYLLLCTIMIVLVISIDWWIKK